MSAIAENTFLRHVRDAFEHLDDLPYLAAHPLAEALRQNDRPLSAGELRRELLGVIAELRPPTGTPTSSVVWRRWRALALRQLEGASTAQIARELGVCDRQARRDLLAGTDAAAAALLVSLTRARVARPTPVRRDEEPTEQSAGSRELAAESARLAAASSGETCEIAAVLESALSTTAHLAESRRAQYRTVVAAGLPRVGCGEAPLRQTLLCLLSLALGWGKEPRIEIEVSSGVDTLDVSLLVASGNSGQDLDRDVEAGESASLLDAARNLIGSLGGVVDLVRVDGDLDVRLRLPTAREATVLVVDDNPDVVDLFRRYLASSGYRLLQARTPRTALELARTARPDVITLDVMLPSQDGWQVLAELRGDPRTAGVPVIVCSVLPERRLAESLGVAEFLAKPVSPRSLRDAIRRCLDLPDRHGLRDGASQG